MEKLNLPQFIDTQHRAFIALIQSLSDADYLAEKNGKWTAGQQMEHILRSVRPVALAFGLPAWTLRLLFGKANRPSRSYAALVEKYQQKLAAGYSASSQFLPPPVKLAQRQPLVSQLEKQVARLNRRLGNYSEIQLETLLLPHPLLGKLTLREMLYFTAYHVEHHQKLTDKNLKSNNL